MKRAYETPFAEKIEFNYTEIVVASPGGDHGDVGVGVSKTDVGCNRIPGHDLAKMGGNGVCSGGGNGGSHPNGHGHSIC